jgi:hypothetical protein
MIQKGRERKQSSLIFGTIIAFPTNDQQFFEMTRGVFRVNALYAIRLTLNKCLRALISLKDLLFKL